MYSYKHDSPLLALAEHVVLTPDNDVASKQQILPLSQPQLQPQSPAVNVRGELYPYTQPECMLIEQKLHKFCGSSGAVAHVKANPSSLFTNNQATECLVYHDGYNVMTPYGLLKWQHWVLDSVCGLMPPATKNKSILRLPKHVQAELQSAESGAQMAALSIDV